MIDLEAEASGQQGETELIQAHALPLSLGGELGVQIDGESKDELAAGFHDANSTASGIDIGSTAEDTSHMITETTQPTFVAVAACQVRPGDRVALCQAGENYTPDFNEVAVAEYSPVGGVIAFCVGFKSEHHEGGVNFIPTPGWGRAFPGHYSWSKHFYATPEDAEVINARVDLFHEVYPDA